MIRAIEAAVPGVEVLRPGTVALRSRGPARYYGGERAAAATLAGIAADHGAPGVRAGVADTPFAAEQAARARPVRPGERVRIVPVGGSSDFLADLPLGVLGDPDLAMVLGRLGIATLGEFATLGDEQVRDRFGVAGAFLHRLAGGRDPREVASRAVPPELRVEASFEPPLDRADQVAFAFRRSADDFAARLRSAGLVATTIRVGIVDERDLLLERTWVHPRWFDAADVVDRVRWQLAGGVDPSGLEAPVVQVVLEPVAVDDAANHERGLWGTGPDERVHHALARVQGLVGHDGVVTPRIGGGRTLAERVVLVPWGDAPAGGERALATVRDRPWPGRLPGPPPATVLERPRPVDVVTADGGTVDVDDRGALTGAPERFRADGERGGGFASVTAWAGPWPLVVRWWESGGRRLHRLQLVDEGGRRGTWCSPTTAGGPRRSRRDGRYLMGYSNPPIPWSQFERALSDKRPDAAHAGDGGDSPAWSRKRSRYVPPPPPSDDGDPVVPYAELHAHSTFSFLDGASGPEHLVEEAARLHLHGLALTDHDGFYGAARMAEVAEAYPTVSTVYGTELSLGLTGPQNGVPDPEGTHLLLLADGQDGYHRLAGAVTRAHLAAGAEKGRPRYDLDDLAAQADGHWRVLTGCRKGTVRQALERGGESAADEALRALLDRFGTAGVVVELTDHGDPLDTPGTTSWPGSQRGTPCGSSRPGTCTTPPPTSSPWPPPSPRCVHGAASTRSTGGCRLPRPRTCAPAPRWPGASPGTRERSRRASSWRTNSASDCGRRSPGCPTSRSPRGTPRCRGSGSSPGAGPAGSTRAARTASTP